MTAPTLLPFLRFCRQKGIIFQYRHGDLEIRGPDGNEIENLPFDVERLAPDIVDYIEYVDMAAQNFLNDLKDRYGIK